MKKLLILISAIGVLSSCAPLKPFFVVESIHAKNSTTNDYEMVYGKTKITVPGAVNEYQLRDTIWKINH